MTIIEMHSRKFGVESSGFGSQAGAEQARDKAIRMLHEWLATLCDAEIELLHPALVLESDGAEIWFSPAQDRLIRNSHQTLFSVVRNATDGWRCWEQGYSGETPHLDLNAEKEN